MAYETTIPDLLIKPLSDQEIEGGRLLQLLEFDDHLLRRFGRMELIELEAKTVFQPILRKVADEVWFILEGEVEGFWLDRRPNSSSEGARERHPLPAPSLVLVPFGVAFACRTVSGTCTLLRVMTHAPDPTEEQAVISWEELLEG
jgi:mannose-6-phosphate isomerase-like protein (cupin superfamily)